VARDQGRVTTGEDQEQAYAGQQVLYDLRHQSVGVVPSVRVTCSAPSQPWLLYCVPAGCDGLQSIPRRR
jgi:hypothetical protein